MVRDFVAVREEKNILHSHATGALFAVVESRTHRQVNVLGVEERLAQKAFRKARRRQGLTVSARCASRSKERSQHLQADDEYRACG